EISTASSTTPNIADSFVPSFPSEVSRSALVSVVIPGSWVSISAISACDRPMRFLNSSIDNFSRSEISFLLMGHLLSDAKARPKAGPRRSVAAFIGDDWRELREGSRKDRERPGRGEAARTRARSYLQRPTGSGVAARPQMSVQVLPAGHAPANAPPSAKSKPPSGVEGVMLFR